MKQASKHREGSRQIRRHEKQGRTPAQRLLDSGTLQQEAAKQLKKKLTELNPFTMRNQIQDLEDRFWRSRQELLHGEEEETLALAVAPPLRSEAPARTAKPSKKTTKNQVATVS
jgi:hypothetical protein